MVTSIVLKGTYQIGISATGKIKTPDGITVDIKDVPFVRYRFSEYGDNELKFIIENKKKFPCVHVVEIELNNNTADLLDKITEMDDMIGKLVYIPITNQHVESGLSEDELSLISSIVDCDFDRLIIKDKSTTLHSVALSKLKKQIRAVTDIPDNEIGVCGGACCFMDGNACLTAVRAREMLAKYSERDDIVVPSANHEGKIDTIDSNSECTNKCGCIRYHVYNSDMPAPVSKGSSKGTKSSKKEGDSQSKSKEPKRMDKGYTKIEW